MAPTVNSSLTKECQNGDSTKPDSTPKSLLNTVVGFLTNHDNRLCAMLCQQGFPRMKRTTHPVFGKQEGKFRTDTIVLSKFEDRHNRKTLERKARA